MIFDARTAYRAGSMMGQIVVNYGYRHYLTTATWRAKRAQRLEIDEHRCVRCKATERLEVHHIDYCRAGDEDVETDLETLCRACHMREHGKDPTLPAAMPASFYSDLFWARDSMIAAQEDIAEAAGIDLDALDY